MDKKNREFLLKVLSGNHQGAEIVFGYESAVIGSDGSSDVVLSDSLISPRHLEITFGESGITLKPLEGKVFVDGKLIREETAVVEELQFITIGSTHIVIGPADQKWPTISAADAPQIEEDSEAKKEMEIVEDKLPIVATNTAQIKRKKTLLYSGVALIMATFAIALLFFMSMFPDQTKVVEKPDTYVLLQELIRELDLTTSVVLGKNPAGFSISGYTSSNEVLSTLRSKLAAIDPLIKQKIYSEEKILSEISMLLGSIESHPRVQAVSSGVFLLTGYAYDKDQWGKIRKRILEDILGITDLQDEVILPSKAFNLASPIILKYKLVGKVGVIPQPDGIAIGGLVSADEEENWKMAKIKLEKVFGEDVLLKNFVRISDPDVIKHQYFGSEVNSVSISESGMNWIGFKDGTKYMVGSMLSNGYLIKDITPENIVLTKNNQTIILKIGELK